MRRQNKRGFTLIELLVVVSVLGLLMAVILPNIFGATTDANAFACQGNLQKLYGMLVSYKNRHRGTWPPHSGARFVLAVTQDRAIYEPTPQNVGYFHCPECRDGEVYVKAAKDPGEWMQSLDAATSEDTSYAGRDMKRYGKRVGTSNLEPLISDDNEGDLSNHPGSMNVLFAGGQVVPFLYQEWVEKGLLPDEEDLNVPVGPDSPINEKNCDLTKLKVD